jgi:type IV secretion system protein VirD4
MEDNKMRKFEFRISKDEFKRLFFGDMTLLQKNILIVFVIGTFTSFITVIGMLLGYVRGYLRLGYSRYTPPTLAMISPQLRVSMLVGAIVLWFVLLFIPWSIYQLTGQNFFETRVWIGLFIANAFFMWIAYKMFYVWGTPINNFFAESSKFGTARFAEPVEMEYYTKYKGIFIGHDMTFPDAGHLLTVAGTRGGKGTNLILPNLLGVGSFEGSWVVIDPKGENAAVSANFQRKQGKQVIVLNPWNMLSDSIGKVSSYNPLDLLSDPKSINLVDDAQVIAEMLVPIDASERDKFFSDAARSIVAGLLVYIAVEKPEEERNLNTLYKMLRLSTADWENMLVEMAGCKNDSDNGAIIANTANEIRQLAKAGEKTFGIIMACMMQATDFIKSPVLQESLKSGFKLSDLSNGNVALYIIIPPDKLQSHSRWLRLIVTTSMRAVVRNPDKRVCFILDEFSALGYLSEVEVALSTYAGYGITVWPILQSLIQLQAHYKTWETFIGNTAVRHYFNVSDNFTAEYVSTALGTKTNMLVERSILGKQGKSESNSRPLVTTDEVRRGSGDAIFTFIADKPPVYFAKYPYYKMKYLHPDDVPVYDDNPYYKK